MPTSLVSEAFLSPWSMLTEKERTVLVSKLIRVEGEALGENHFHTAGQVFDAALLESGALTSAEALLVPERILTLRNFMVQTGAGQRLSLWEHVASLKGVRDSYLELTVLSRNEFLQQLDRAGFAINREPFWSRHRFDSAREVTRFSLEPSLHFCNDRADEVAYGPDYFFVHWDVTSVWFEKSSLWCRWVPGARTFERIRAALKHKTGFARPDEVESYLASRASQPPSDLT